MLEILNEGFQNFLAKGDPRVKDLPMMQTPFPGLAMIVAYVYFVLVGGPKFMKNRQPYELRTLMVIYNFLLVAINLYLFLAFGYYGWFNKFSYKCQPVDYSNAHDAVRLVQMGYIFYLIKFVEFADTIFFILRKKYNQISALHVIHHSIVPFSLWFGIKFAPGGHHSLFPFMNSFVHVIMYFYYGLAAMGEKYKKYLFWKKYMTFLQLAQFVIVIVHTTSLYVNNCEKTIKFMSLNFLHALLFFGLFANFFIKTYTKKSAARSKATLTPPHVESNGKDSEKMISNGHARRRINPNTKNKTSSDTDSCNNLIENGITNSENESEIYKNNIQSSIL